MSEKPKSVAPAAALLLVLSLLDGVVSSAAFPPLSLAPLAFLTGTLTLFVVRRLSLPLAAMAAYLYGISFAVAVAPWVYTAMHEHYHIGALASAAFNLFIVGGGVGFYLGTPFVIWRWLCGPSDGEQKLTRWQRVLSAAALFYLFELLRTHGVLSMPWGLIGASVTGSELLSQSVDLFGVLGLSFASMLCSALLVEAVEEWLAAEERSWILLARNRAFVGALAVPVALLVYGGVRYAQVAAQLEAPAGETLKVAAIQANIPQGDRWKADLVPRTMGTHIKFSGEVARDFGPDLIIWPETAMNTYITDPGNEYQRRIHQIAFEHDAHFLLGGPHAEFTEAGEPRYFNSIFQLDPRRKFVARYDKIELLAFAEYNPLSNAPFFPRPAEVPRDYSPGERAGIFEVKGVKLGAMICFESLYPWLARDLVGAGAQVLVNVSNDAWFQKTKAPYQHIEQTRLRAIELRRYLIRNAGTGVSAIIDPLGRYVGEPLPIFTQGVLTGTVSAREGLTPYGLWGDWPLLLGALGILIGVGVRRLRLV